MIAIVIVNHRTWQLTALAAQSVADFISERKLVFIVDNSENSERDISELLAFSWTGFKSVSQIHQNAGNLLYTNQITNNALYIVSVPNMGFAAANNIVLRWLCTVALIDYCLLLNSDALFFDSSVGHALKFLKSNSRLGLLGMTLLEDYDPNKIQNVGGVYNVFTGKLKLVKAGLNLEIPEKIHEHIDYPPGAAMWVSVKALSEVGVMDETFFLYGEEYEWSRRFKKAGFDIDYCANAFLKHKGSATISGNSSANSELSDFYWLRSRWLLARRNGVLSTTVFCLTSLIFPLRRALKQQWKRVHLYFWVMIHPESYYNDYKKLRP